MKPSKVREIECIGYVLGFIMTIIGAMENINFLYTIGIVIFVGAFLFRLACYRCPHCGEHLGRSKGEYCPHCGEKME